MQIINHGEWIPYTPKPFPPEYSSNAMFCSNNKSGVDWYVYRRKPGNFVNNSIKMTVMMENDGTGTKGMVMAANKDVSFLFPQYMHVIEVIGLDSSDPQRDFGRKIYDSVAGTFTDAPAPTLAVITLPVPPVVESIANVEIAKF